MVRLDEPLPRTEVRMPPDPNNPPAQQESIQPVAKPAALDTAAGEAIADREADETTARVDQAGAMMRLLGWLRTRGFLTHRELVDILGVGDVQIEHRHPDSDAWETKEVTVNGVARQQRIGKASVGEDSVAARHYVQELLEPGSTKPPAAQDEAA